MITITNVSKTYHLGKKNAFPALKNFTESIEDGEFIAIVGESGAGKSTLLHLLACIDGFDQGDICIDGESIKSLGDSALAKLRNRVTAIVLQNFALLEEYTVYENVMVPLLFNRDRSAGKKQKVLAALSRVGIADLAEKQANELSGGQRQRVSIARALVNHPKYLFADEPTGSLDSKTADEIMDLFRDLNQQGLTIALVTHNMELAQSCSRIICIHDGEKREAYETFKA